MPSFNNSNEKVTLRSLDRTHRDAEDRQLPYALFGGAGVAAYAGHLTRRLHDIDYVIPLASLNEWLTYFAKRQCQERQSPKSVHAHFRKFDETADANRIAHTVFPERFRLIDIDSPTMDLLFEYDFSAALQHRVLRTLSSLDNTQSLCVWVIPIEDLLLTKLFPAIEPNSVYDIAALLSSDEVFNIDYFISRVLTLANYSQSILINAQAIFSLYRQSVWLRMANEEWLTKIKSISHQLALHLTTSHSGTADGISRSAVVISHGPDCLDGVAAAVSVARAYGPAAVSVHFTHPSDIDQLFVNLSLEDSTPRDLWITDISWKSAKTEETLKALSANGWRIFWVDHHANALVRLARGLDDLGLTGYNVTAEHSAARLTYDFLLKTLPFSGPLKPLVDFKPIVMLADDADRWINRLPRSRELALVVGEMGTVAYDHLLNIDAGGTWTQPMEQALARSKKRLEESTETALQTRIQMTTPTGFSVVGCICTGFSSEVADRLRDQHTNAVFVIYNTENRRISLRRSQNCDVDCAQIAMALGGGGHPAAAGFDVPDLDTIIVTKITDVVVKTLLSFSQDPAKLVSRS